MDVRNELQDVALTIHRKIAAMVKNNEDGFDAKQLLEIVDRLNKIDRAIGSKLNMLNETVKNLVKEF